MLLTHLLHAEDECHLLASALILHRGGHLVAQATPLRVPPLLLQAVHLPRFHESQDDAGKLLAKLAVKCWG